MNTKKLWYIFFTLLICFLSACNDTNSDDTVSTKNTNRYSIVTSIFPSYDWTKEILGEKINDVDLILLVDNGIDLHSYQPSVKDLAQIADCDLLIYTGGESEEWIEDALNTGSNPDRKVICLMDLLGSAVREEEIKEGMQEEETEEREYDEHIWLSLKNAALFTENIAQALEELDPANRETYASNSAIYVNSINNLDAKYQDIIDTSSQDTILFADRFPFLYMVKDYGLDYYAAFVGCSAETEASFQTVLFLANKVNELNLPAILELESGDGKLARTVLDNTTSRNAQILTMDSLQSTTAEDIQSGITYLSAMESNLSVLQQALQ